MDHFARLGLPRAYAIDRDALEDAYLSLAQKWHPDRFAGADSGQRRAAMETSAAVNEGYRVLRDPVRRAEYLCKLHGVDVDSSDERGGAPKMDQAFLIEMIERREQVADARDGGADALRRLRGSVDDEAEQVLDDAIDALEAEQVDTAARALVRRRYLQRLLEEIDTATDKA